ncbi:hypothetical protein ACJRO7_001268 [Eucalyptus globulus]|uniref:Uncharacterized protein n=1 Tax=Eucalyptus globulus TaxID=34317 RepID=A0ABD3LQE6_EUCGL
MSRKGASLQKDVPWRASSGKPIPKIHHNPVLSVSQTPYSNYAISPHFSLSSLFSLPPLHNLLPNSLSLIAFFFVCGFLRNPRGVAFARLTRGWVCGGDLVHPGFMPPAAGYTDLKFMEPVERELNLLGKLLDSAVNLMNKLFIDR